MGWLCWMALPDTREERGLRRRADAGDRTAARLLGISLAEKASRYFRRGVPGRPVAARVAPWRTHRYLMSRALRYLRQAATAGDIAAAARICNGDWYWHTGKGKDTLTTQEKVQYLRAAAHAGHAELAYRLSWLLRQEGGQQVVVGAGLTEAGQYLRMAADGGHVEAAHQLGGRLRRETGHEAEAEHWLRQALAAKPLDRNAQVEFGRLLRDTGRADEAVHWMGLACSSLLKGDPVYFPDGVAREFVSLLQALGRFTEAAEWDRKLAAAAQRHQARLRASLSSPPRGPDDFDAAI